MDMVCLPEMPSSLLMDLPPSSPVCSREQQHHNEIFVKSFKIQTSSSFVLGAMNFKIGSAVMGINRGEHTHLIGWAFIHSDGSPALPAYPVLVNRSGMASRSEVDSTPLLIIHLYLKGMDVVGTPPTNLVQHLRPYNPVSLKFVEREFDFGTREKIKLHQEMVAMLCHEIGAVPAGRMLLFVSTHSEEERGDLFTGQEGAGKKPVAVDVETFFKLLWSAGCLTSREGPPSSSSLAVGWSSTRFHSKLSG
ncbi:hypothetical protein BU15DRAFT_79305 [Melanogaster broomeanus]|nr:hypothetical protein BU15DRAFT_79305 [Melanogaster broomeanus]